MKFSINNTKTGKSYKVVTDDSGKPRKIVRKKTGDEEICPECKKAISECECEKVGEAPAETQTHDEKIELSEKEAKALKELIGLLPDLKKILEDRHEAENKSKDKEKGEGDKPEEKGDEPDKKEKKPEPEEESEKKTGDEADPNVIFEEPANNEEITPEELEFDEEIIEDEGGNGVCDSALNPGAIEQKASDGNKDAVSHEVEVAKAWADRYNSLLNTK